MMSDKIIDVNLLNSEHFPILAFLKAEALEELRQIAKPMETISNVAVITEGKPNTYLYFVVSGLFCVTKRYNNEVVEVATIGPGQFFGEASLLYNKPTSAEVRSISDSQLLRIPNQVLQSICASNDNFKRTLQQTAERRSASTALAINPIFNVLPQAIREIILHNAELIELNAGQILFVEHDVDTHYMYILVSGTAEAFIQNPNNEKRHIILSRLSSGDEIGEIPLITEQSHTASVIIKSDAKLLQIDSSLVRNWMHRYSDFRHALKTCVQKKLHHSERVIQTASQKLGKH